MRTRAKQKLVAEATALGARVPRSGTLCPVYKPELHNNMTE